MNKLKYACICLGFAYLILTSCNQNSCDEVVCENGGNCVEGECECPEGFFGPSCEFQLDPCTIRGCVDANTISCRVDNEGRGVCQCESGYEGNQCEVPWADKYPGEFTAQENCNGTQQTFGREIETGPEFNQITLINFHDKASPITTSKIVANLERSTLLELYPQFMIYGRVNGAGSRASNGDLSLSYVIAQASDTLQCICVLTKVQ
ncbi:MAG: hypothetical protein AAFR59_11400 [Bacteroidota bacterium]